MSFYTAIARPCLFRLPAETAHNVALGALRVGMPPGVCGLVRACHQRAWPELTQQLWGLTFTNPVGIAAGLDKNGRVIDPLAAFGFSHVEAGTVTGQAQPGNPKPRAFRLPLDQALVNRMGFNNDGAPAVAARLGRAFRRRRPGCVLGINLGKSKIVDVSAALSDYEISVRFLAPLADYVVVNVSSPNTPGLRDLQGEALLRPLLSGVRGCLDSAASNKPLLLKIAPDLSDEGVDAAVDVALETGCNGIIATNTTIGRTGLRTPGEQISAIGAGGLSGAPLRVRSTAMLARVSRRLAGRMPVIGVGGIDSADAAWEKICHGASLVQVYTGLIYHGLGLAGAINRGLVQKLKESGLANITQAVGRNL